jgi:hypothetical protein
VATGAFGTTEGTVEQRAPVLTLKLSPGAQSRGNGTSGITGGGATNVATGVGEEFAMEPWLDDDLVGVHEASGVMVTLPAPSAESVSIEGVLQVIVAVTVAALVTVKPAVVADAMVSVDPDCITTTISLAFTASDSILAVVPDTTRS